MNENGLLPARYADVHLIARGGMGEVYRATDTVLGRDVAVKLLADWYAADKEVRARFTREALAAARLSGEANTVTVYDVGEWDERPFIVMEHLAGGSLADRVDGGAVEPARALEWLEQTARALDAAHEKGVVHRDVKPANLLLHADGTVRVADFGIASATGTDSLTRTGTVLGTAGYLSPEQATGGRAAPASDRYALAVVAFELLTGRRPFAAESPTAEAMGHAHRPVPSASARNSRLPAAVDPVFERALAKDPDARYPTCGEFVGDLRHALAGDATATVPIAPVTVTAHPRRAAWPVAAAIVALLLVGIGLAIAFSGDGEPRGEMTTVVTTAPGRTEQVTVTAEPPPPPPPPTTSPPPPPPADAETLNNQGFELLKQGRYEEALPLSEQAFRMLEGSGSLLEAYAAYNYAWALAGVGRCDEALPLLDHSQAIQGERKEISQLRKDCEKSAGGGRED